MADDEQQGGDLKRSRFSTAPSSWVGMLPPGGLIAATALFTFFGCPGRLSGASLGIAAAALIWLPGWALADLLGISARLDLLERLALGFALGCGLLSVEAFFAYGLRLPLLAVILVHLAVTAAFFVARASHARRPGSEAESGTEATVRHPYGWLLALTLAVYVLATSRWASLVGPDFGGDAWFHLANITKLLRGGIVSPDCAFYKGVGADPRYLWPVWHLAVAMVARAGGVDASHTWVYLSRVLPFLALCSLAFLVRVVLGSERAKWIVLAAAVLSYPVFYSGITYAVHYPYPLYFVLLGLIPVHIGLVAGQLQEPRREGLVGIALVSIAAASSHLMGVLVPTLFLLVLGLLVVLYPLKREARRGYLWAGIVTAIGIAPQVLLVLSVYGSYGHSVDLGAIRAERLVSVTQTLQVVSPERIIRAPAVLAVLVSLVLAALAPRRPGVLVLIATAMLPLCIPFNPLAATCLAPIFTPALLSRLYYWPQRWIFGAILLAAGPAGIAWIWIRWLRLDRTPRKRPIGPGTSDKRRKEDRHRRAREAYVRRRRVVLGTLLAVFSLALAAIWTEKCRQLILGELRPPQLMMIAAGSILLVLFPVILRIVGLRPSLVWLDAVPPAAMVGLVAVTAFIGFLTTGGLQSVREQIRQARGKYYWATWPSRYPGWEGRPGSLSPTFMDPLAQMPARSAVVYCPETWVEAMIPGFTGQYVLYGRDAGNPRADRRARKKAVDVLSSLTQPRFPSAEALETLSRFQVNYVLLPSYRRRFCGALDEYPELFEPVDRSLGSGLYRVRITPERIAAARNRSDPWDLSGHPPETAQPIARFAGLELLSLELDRDEYAPGDTGIVTFVWRSVMPMKRDYRVVCHMNAPGGPDINVDHYLLNGAITTARLRPGQVVRERYAFAIPSAAAGRTYTMGVGLWNRKRDIKLPVRSATRPVAGGWIVVAGRFQVKP